MFSLVLPLSVSAQEQSLNFELVVQTLKAHQPDTVAKALSALKSDHPNAFKNYILIARSMSIQGSSFEAPRAAVFTNDGAKFVMTFNGQPGERGYDRLEMMSFNDQTKHYDFREIKFLGDSGVAGTYEISESGGIQGRCLNCHGQNALPIWDSFPFWPDYYGSFAKQPSGLKAYQQNEVAAYAKFAAKAATHDRYQVLPAKTFSEITEMNSEIGRGFAERVRDVAKVELAEIPSIAAALKTIFDSFDASAVNRSLNLAEAAELSKYGEYHATKLARYSRNHDIEKDQLLDDLIAADHNSIATISQTTGVAPDNKLDLWTYTQLQPADLKLLPLLRQSLGTDVGYLHNWSIVPGGRFIDFSHPDGLSNESGIEKALEDLL